MTILERFEAKIDKSDGCWNWTAAMMSVGYGTLKMNGKMVGAHRASWLLYRGEIPDGAHVLHHCDNRRCVRPEHLFLGTRSENMQDMIHKGRRIFCPVSGENHPKAKLTSEQVSFIRREYRRGSGARMARQLGVGRSAVVRVVNGKTWALATAEVPA